MSYRSLSQNESVCDLNVYRTQSLQPMYSFLSCRVALALSVAASPTSAAVRSWTGGSKREQRVHQLVLLVDVVQLQHLHGGGGAPTTAALGGQTGDALTRRAPLAASDFLNNGMSITKFAMKLKWNGRTTERYSNSEYAHSIPWMRYEVAQHFPTTRF